MTTLERHLTDGPEIDRSRLDRLRGHFAGRLLQPGDDDYDAARRVWNGRIDARPALVARCTGAADVTAALRLARELDLPVTVRGGGHGVNGSAVADGAVTLDLSPMKQVAVDPAARRVRAGAGVLWGELDAATQAHGLATTGGTVSSVGIGGLTLAGGFGHLMRRHGLTVDNLLAVDLVTVDGERRRVDATSEPELFWGLRGGGGNFGVATAFTYALHPVGPQILGGPVYWPLDQARLVLQALAALGPTAPDELGIVLVVQPAPPVPFLPAEQHGRPVLGLLLTWCGDPADGERALAPFRSLGRPLADRVGPVPYARLQTLLDGGAPAGRGYYWRSTRLPSLPDTAIDRVLALADTFPSPYSLISGWVVGGAVSRVPAEATAVGAREPGFELRVIAGWAPDDPDPDRHLRWVRDGWASLHACGEGRQYATFLSDEGLAGVRAAFGPQLPRLVALKSRWDPTNVFSSNVNLPTTGGTK